MEDKRLKEIKKKLDRLNDQDRFEDAIALIETIPEEERDLEIKVYHAHMLNNIAMITLGDFDDESEHYKQDEHDDETSPKIPYINEAIDRLENLKEEGKEDWYWNKRMANAYYSKGHVLENQSLYYYSLALPYFKKWYEVAEKKKKSEARKMVDECAKNLADRYFAQGKYLEAFSIINEMSGKWEGYEPCFSVTGVKEEEEGEIDEALSQKLDELAEGGNQLLEQGDQEGALKVWQKAIDLIPEPKSVQAETVWFEASMGDIYFSQKAFHEANLLFDRALKNISEEGNNPFILMRCGECCYELGDNYWAKYYLKEAYKAEGEKIFKSEEQNIKYLDFLLEELKKDEEGKKHPFYEFDFKDFWNDSDYALKKYVSAPPTDELITETEKELGYKLPASYIQLMKQHNGGIPVNTGFATKTFVCYGNHVTISGIFGIGKEKTYSLCGELGSQFWIDEWEYPPIGVAICDTPTGGHDMVFLDYRECGPQGEPKVVHVAQESDYEITYLAENFEEFIRGLVHEDEFEDEDELYV